MENTGRFKLCWEMQEKELQKDQIQVYLLRSNTTDSEFDFLTPFLEGKDLSERYKTGFIYIVNKLSIFHSSSLSPKQNIQIHVFLKKDIPPVISPRIYLENPRSYSWMFMVRRAGNKLQNRFKLSTSTTRSIWLRPTTTFCA